MTNPIDHHKRKRALQDFIATGQYAEMRKAIMKGRVASGVLLAGMIGFAGLAVWEWASLPVCKRVASAPTIETPVSMPVIGQKTPLRGRKLIYDRIPPETSKARLVVLEKTRRHYEKPSR